jgi:hypothetical protein
MKSWQLMVGLGVILVTGIVIVVLIRLQLPASPTAMLDIEIAKAALTGCVVAVIGAVVGALVKAREQRVQAMRLQADLLNQFIQQLGEYYRSVKATRRRLRSVGLTNRYDEPPYDKPPEELNEKQLEAYKEAMESIEKIQLGLEDFKIRVRMLPFFSDIKDVAPWLRQMEEYLRAILRERDEFLSKIRPGESILFAKLAYLAEFTGDADASTPDHQTNYKFKSHFADPYDEIWEKISWKLKIFSDA